MMKCPVCGGAELIHEARDIPYTFVCPGFFVFCAELFHYFGKVFAEFGQR